MTEHKRLVYDKWDMGEFGNKNPSQAPNGSWTGENVVVYRDGTIGPRPGLKKINVGNPGINGPMLGFGYSPVAQEDNTPIFYILDDRVYLFDPNFSTLHRSTGDLHVAPVNADNTVVLSKESVRLIGDEVYFTVDNDRTYRLNCRTQVLTGIADSGQGTDIELYRDRMLVANGANRVTYSDAADFQTWQVGSFFDVGAAYRIIHMVVFRDTLLLFTLSGIWAMTGTADDGTLRRISEAIPPNDKAVAVGNDELFYIPSTRGAPVTFNGSFADEKSLSHLEDWINSTSSSRTYGVSSLGNRDVVFVSNTDKMLWRKNGAWSFHEFDVTAGPWVTRWFDDYLVIADPGTVSTKPKFYVLWLDVDRPAFTSDTWAQPGDNTTTPLTASFAVPDYLSPQGTECRVTSVTVDFTKYATGSATANNIDVAVTTLYRENNDGTQTHTKTGAFNEAGTEATTSGVTERLVVRGFPVGFGGGYRVALQNLKGVKIDRIIVEIEEQKVPVTYG